ncbi:MAG: hypothetical protein IJJ84_07730 [Kiritimatiellae bacterium]|nr:hypothetical protein [Kiritimatiellia bacterium]
MKFTYTYRSSDGQRRTAEIEAESRDAAFERVRAELGIKPIKVVAAVENGGALGERALPNGRDKRDSRMLWGAAILAALVVLGSVWWFVKHGSKQGPIPETITVNTPQGAVTLSVATPLPRQTIPGDRRRIEAGRDTIFTNAAERLLARFAEPGRAVASLEGAKPTDADFAACLREPIRIASTDFTEVVDLKRIVTGMKREMRAYIAGGGTVEQYLLELVKRQKLEASYRENAEKRLEGMLSKPKEAYAYWLKANASLKSMGIYELPLPPALHGYQAGLDLDE